MRPSPSTPTLQDVARAAGVSTATVSRCLNSPERVVTATRERVMQAVKTLGYTPNFAARVMAAKRSFTIGAVIPTMDNAIFARGIQAFQEELHARGYTLLVASSLYQPSVEEEQIRALVSRGADGVLLIGYARPPALYDYLAQHRTPALVAWAHQAQNPQPAVGFDNHAAMSQLTQAVMAQGHRNIAMITAPTAGNDRTAERLRGMRTALQNGGIDPETVPVIETPYGMENGALALVDLMKHHPRTTAAICGNDVLAVGAMRAAQDLGLSIPRDLSITGFDDMELASIVSPGLTSVHVPHRDMGRRAARALIGMVETPGAAPAPHALDTQVILRGSLGPAPA
ncbi:MAG: LacI family DNA-binding transcriptional regulator [Sulfitobacter sp.]